MIDAAFAPAAEAVAAGRIPARRWAWRRDGRRWVTHTGMAALALEPEALDARPLVRSRLGLQGSGDDHDGPAHLAEGRGGSISTRR